MIHYCKKHDYIWEEGTEPGCRYCIEEQTKAKDKPPEGTVFIGGQDLAKERDFSALVVLEIEDKRAKLVALKEWPHVDYSTVMADTEALYKKWHLVRLGVDAASMGGPIVEFYQYHGLTVEGIKPSGPTKADMVNFSRTLIGNGQLHIGRGRLADELAAELKEQELIVGATEYPRFAHPQNRHDDLLWALNFACFAARPWLSEPHFVIRMR
jgi:Terminase RNaseH-like domain